MAENLSQAITQKDFDRICRTCLGFQEVNSIFQIFVEDIKATDLLEYTTAIQVAENDLMPQNICDNCLTDLYRVYEFKKQCQENEEVLKALVQQEFNIKVEEKRVEDEENVEQKPQIYDVKIEDQESSFVQNDDASKVAPTLPKLHSCRTCGESYTTFQELKTHRTQSGHNTNRGIKCEVCQKEFRNMKVHMRAHTQEKPYQCDMCPKSFSVLFNLRRHNMSHTGERPYICNVCDKGFIQATTLQDHLKSHERSKRSYSCKYCGRRFKILTMYYKHMQQHNEIVTEEKGNEKQRPFLCELCSCTFATKGTLNTHMLTHGERNFLCSVCGKAFHREQLLMAHSRVHTGERPYSCNLCQKSFKQSATLETHKLNHTGEKPHKCSYCAKTFRQLPHLKYHIRTHTGQKPYSCVFCEKSFASTGTLQVHVRTHTGVKPYLCPICDKGFYDSTGMKKHRKLHDKKVETASNGNDCENIVTETVVYKIEKD